MKWNESTWLRLGGAAWAIAVLTGFALVTDYQRTAGEPSAAPAQWPAESRLTRAADRPTLVVFAHPRCPCTRATVSELARMVSRTSRRPLIHVAFHVPSGDDTGWRDTNLWTSAAHIEGVQLFADVDGREAARFAAATSGASLLYDAAGRLAFAGGLTGGRGHEGESFGQQRILALLAGAPPDRPDSPVFGCPLRNP